MSDEFDAKARQIISQLDGCGYSEDVAVVASALAVAVMKERKQYEENVRLRARISELETAVKREREECAKVAEQHQAQHELNQRLADQIGRNVAASIRARGEN